jgi:hypothetical protein
MQLGYAAADTPAVTSMWSATALAPIHLPMSSNACGLKI